MFNISKSKSININDCDFRNNNVLYFTNSKAEICITGEYFEGNVFDFTEYDVNQSNHLLGMCEMQLNQSKKIIYNENGITIVENERVVASNTNSRPEVSNDKNNVLYIEPFDFETLGNLHLYNINTNNDKILLNSTEVQNETGQGTTIKLIKWLDEHNIICIIGQAYGTVSKGGDLYKYNILDNRLECIYKNENGEEVINFEFVDKNIKMRIIKFDTDFINYSVKSKILT